MDIRWLILLLLYGFNVTNIHRFANCSQNVPQKQQADAVPAPTNGRRVPPRISVDTNFLNAGVKSFDKDSPLELNASLENQIKLLLLLHMIYRFPYKIGMLKKEIRRLQQANAKEKGAKSKQTNIKNIQDQIERLSGKYDSSLKDFVTLLGNDANTLITVLTTYHSLTKLYGLYKKLKPSESQRKKYALLWKLGWILDNAADKIPKESELDIFTEKDKYMEELKRFHLLERYKNNIVKILVDHSWETLALNELLDVMEEVDSADKLVELGYIDVLINVARLTGIYDVKPEDLHQLASKKTRMTKKNVLELLQRGYDKRLKDTVCALTGKARQVGVNLEIRGKDIPKTKVSAEKVKSSFGILYKHGFTSEHIASLKAEDKKKEETTA